MNFGGKFFVDIIPVIDALELSFNMGVWEYEAGLTYPVLSGTTLSTTTRSLSVDSQGIDSRWGIHNIPYAKMHFDLTIRKYSLLQ
jgi:hypothetical protein